MAPECSETNHRYTDKVDVFGAGMIMVYMATAVNQFSSNPDADWNKDSVQEELSRRFET